MVELHTYAYAVTFDQSETFLQGIPIIFATFVEPKPSIFSRANKLLPFQFLTITRMYHGFLGQICRLVLFFQAFLTLTALHAKFFQVSRLQTEHGYL